MHIGQSGLLDPGVELRLYFGEIVFRLGLGGDFEARIAQASYHVLRGHEAVVADEAKEHLPRIAAEPVAALGQEIEQSGLVGGGPLLKELSERAVLLRDRE